MHAIQHTIGIIGGGNMGEAFIGAIINTGLAPASHICVTDISDRRLSLLSETYKVRTGTDNSALFAASDIVIIAIKPQQMSALLKALAPPAGAAPAKRKLIISIAAGIRLQTFEHYLYAHLPTDAQAQLPIVRVMPNTPALVLTGMSGMSPNRMATDDDLALTRRLLESMGTVIQFDESDLDAVTALSGSGPAYVFYLAEAMIQGGVRSGLSAENAAALTLQTLKGAVRLMEHQRLPPETLRERVTSPGGTTAAAVAHMDTHRVKDRIAEAIMAATRRADELSRASAPDTN
ncbi:MAG: pyrroline-5-carboxylate reductase [Pseudomonadota bacterium]